MMLRIEGRACLVVGGGKVAEEKICGLLAYGARITVVSPRAVPGIQKRARAGALEWKKRRFAPADVGGAFLVIAATNSSKINAIAFRACRKRGILCNAVDDPENCDFFYPAVVRRGALQFAISTQGYSPALASRLRHDLQKQFGPEWGEWLEHLGERRRQVLAETKPSKKRKERLLAMATPQAFKRFLRQRGRGGA